jgi:kynurenine formamidase
MGAKMGKAQIIDLSVPIQPTPPDSPLKVDIEYIDHKQGAKVFGPVFGLRDGDFPDGKFSAVEKLTLTTHSGTHLDAPWHYWPTSEGKPSRTIDEIPLEWCYSNGVVLDLTHKKAGEEIDIADFKKALEKIQYTLRPFDIVLVMTGATKYYGKPDYPQMHPGTTRESTLWLVDQGIKVMGIDAWGWDKPFDTMVKEVREGKKEKLWAAHFAGKEKEYCHIENLTNLDKIPKPYGFKVAVFPIKIEHAGGGWTRAVAIIDA